MKKKYTTADNPHKGNVGFKRLWLAVCNSWSGFKFAWREESAFRQELFLLAVSIPVIFILNLNYVERFLLISSLSAKTNRTVLIRFKDPSWLTR